MGDEEGVPRPMTVEQILQDLKNVPKTDIVFSTLPGSSKAKDKDPELEDKVEKIAADSIQLVEAHNKLKNCHRPELPKIIDEVQQHIKNLKDAVEKDEMS